MMMLNSGWYKSYKTQKQKQTLETQLDQTNL